MIKPLKNPVYITRPLFPTIANYNKKLKLIWKSKWLSNFGEQHQILEETLTKILNVPHFLLFNNGTIALLSVFRALELSGEVITTPFTFPATVNSLLFCNLTPVFCDIDYDTMNIDPAKIEKLITPKTSAILAVHVYGIPCDIKKIEKIAKKYNLKVIYDGAHVFQTEIKGKSIGNYGDAVMFSFHATKLFNTAEGGGVSFKSKLNWNKTRLLRNFGITSEEEVVSAGINGKMSELQAAFGLSVLDKVPNERIKREEIDKYYRIHLKNIKGIVVPEINSSVTKRSFQYFPIKIIKNDYGMSRDQLHLELKKYNIITRKYFYPLVSNYSFLKSNKSAKKQNLPVSNRVTLEVLCLPFYGSMGMATARKVCTLIKSFSTNENK